MPKRVGVSGHTREKADVKPHVRRERRTDAEIKKSGTREDQRKKEVRGGKGP